MNTEMTRMEHLQNGDCFTATRPLNATWKDFTMIAYIDHDVNQWMELTDGSEDQPWAEFDPEEVVWKLIG